MSDEIKNFRDTLERSESIILELNDTLDRYTTVNSVSIEIVDKNQAILDENQAILKTINTLQINSAAAAKSVFNRVDNLKSGLESIAQDAIGNVTIDTSDLSMILNKKIAQFDIGKLEQLIDKSNSSVGSAIKNFNYSESRLNDASQELDKTAHHLTSKTSALNTAVNDIKAANKSHTMSMMVTGSVIGAVIGFGLATYFQISAISDFYFSTYETKQARLESSVDKLNDFNKWIMENEYQFDFGTFNDAKQNYLKIDKKELETCKDHELYAYENKGKNLIVCLNTD